MKKTVSVIYFVAITFLCSTASIAQKATDQKINYSIIPKLPPPPKPEPFTVTTIPLPDSVVEAVLVNYLPDGKHIIMEVNFAGKKKSDLAVMKEDGSDFNCLTCNLKEEIGDEMPVPGHPLA